MTLASPQKIETHTAAPSRSSFLRTNHWSVAAKVGAVLALVLTSLSTSYYIQSTNLHLLLPVAAIAMSTRFGSARIVIMGLAVLALGAGVLVYQTYLPAMDALLLVSVSAIVALVAMPVKRPLMGIYGLLQNTEHEVLRALLAATPVILVNSEGRIKRASIACTDLFQRSNSALTNMPLAELILGFDHTQHAVSPSGLIEADKHWSILRPDAPDVSVELWLAHTPEGPMLRLVDLTPRQTADAQARELHSQLNKVWRLNSLGEMAATLAHELNQPLGAAASYLHAAQEDMKAAGPLGESAFRTTDMAKNQMLRAGQIIRRMRELLTMEMRTLSKEHFSNVVDDVLPILTLTGQDRNIRIETEIGRAHV